MSPAALEEKIARVSPPYRQELIDFIDFILYRQDHDDKPSRKAPGKKKRVSNFGALRDAIKQSIGKIECALPIPALAEYCDDSGFARVPHPSTPS